MVLQVTSLAWIAALQLAACGDEIGASRNSGPNILDTRSPFAKPKQASAAKCSSADHHAAIAVWKQLRDNYPYHLQTVALSPVFPGGCRALIIAEPPTTLSLAALRDLSPPLMARSETQQHEVGYDGWTRDVVVTLPPTTETELTELIVGLHSAMFGTTYRMDVLDTSQPVPTYRPEEAPIDVGIGPAELHRWLVTESASFIPLGGDDPVSANDLLASSDPEVYLDDAHGLVAWVVPRRADIAAMAGLFRQFTLESDIIVGAMASPTTVAIIARQRAIDPRILQPLRFEIVSLLAAVRDTHRLQQSYERTNPLSGRIDATRDWAPIFLSPELLDTEYGSVLNIADQFLKSWSNNGKTQYVNFDYPAPPTWAFAAPVFEVANADNFRYNWNTSNVSAVVSIDDVEVFWLRRTGALNVSYFPDEDELAEHQPAKQPKVQDLEETAYQFFVKTQTPILARVVQYNALFQIFARFGIASSMKVPAPSRDAATATLVAAARDALTTLRDADDAEIKRRLVKFLNTMFEHQLRERSAAVPAEVRGDMKDKLSQLSGSVEAESERRSRDVKAVSRNLAKLDAGNLAELARIIGAPRSAGIRSDLLEIFKQVRGLGSMFSLFANPEVYKAYARNAKGPPDVWIHTPSIVISWNLPPFATVVGGHDLNAKVAALKFHPESPSLAASQIARRVPVDAVGAKDLGRLDLGPTGPRLAPAPTNRAARTALGTQHRHWPTPVPDVHREKAEPARGELHELSVAKLGDGYRVVDRDGTSHELTTLAEAIELVSHQRGVAGNHITIRFEGMRPDEVRRVLRVAEVKARAEIAGIVKAPEFATRPLDFGKAKLHDTQFRTYEDGAGEIGHVIKVRGEKPTTIEIKVAVREAKPGVLRRLGGKIRDLIKSVLARFSGKRVSPRDFGIELRNRLRTLLRDELEQERKRGSEDELRRELHRLELKIRQEAFDFTIVRREAPVSHGTHDLAA
jgi:hypothetical protein